MAIESIASVGDDVASIWHDALQAWHPVATGSDKTNWATVMHPDAYEEARREVRRERHEAALRLRRNRNV